MLGVIFGSWMVANSVRPQIHWVFWQRFDISPLNQLTMTFTFGQKMRYSQKVTYCNPCSVSGSRLSQQCFFYPNMRWGARYDCDGGLPFPTSWLIIHFCCCPDSPTLDSKFQHGTLNLFPNWPLSVASVNRLHIKMEDMRAPRKSRQNVLMPNVSGRIWVKIKTQSTAQVVHLYLCDDDTGIEWKSICQTFTLSVISQHFTYKWPNLLLPPASA